MSDVVRLAEDNDLKKCVVLALDMIREGYYKDYDIDEVEMTHHAKRAFHQPDWMFLVYEKDDEVVGFFSAQITKTFFGHDLIAEQNLMYIDPKARGNINIAMSFMREFRNWAKVNKCKGAFFAPTVSVHSGFDIIAKRLGYDYVGPMYGRTP
tara:strand:- start:66 stop:521 length:456 start_codon:yes stop_codon:yes gene_type:complete